MVRYASLIPYLEPAGNYNGAMGLSTLLSLIPYLEPAGNYNNGRGVDFFDELIPYLEPAGNYNVKNYPSYVIITNTIP